MDIKTLQINLKNLMNKWFYTREQIHKLLEEYVIVDSGGILRVGLPSAKEITLTTTNNAITTADVAEVKATVTGNTDQELVYGVPVQFVNRATREVLYNGTTDENGECLFQYFTEEAEILPIQARISNDFIFRDDGRLNSYEAWDYNNNVTIQHISTHSIVSRADTSSSVGTLGTLLLSGYCDIDFKVKIPSDGSADVLFCRIVEQTSTGQLVDNGSSNTFKLSDLNLTTEKWYNFHISVLDDRIVLHCKDTGETKRIWLDEAYPYYRFQLLPSSSVPTICFSDVKITRCSDDLSMFIKDKENLFNYNIWSAGQYLNNTTGFSRFGEGEFTLTKKQMNIGEYSIKIFLSEPLQTGFKGLKTTIQIDETSLNKRLIWTFDLINLATNNARIVIVCGDINHKVYVPKSQEITTVSLTTELTATTVECYVTFNTGMSGEYYISNLQAHIQ